MNRLPQQTSSITPVILTLVLLMTVAMGVVVAEAGLTIALALVLGVGIFIGSFASIKFALYVLDFRNTSLP